MTTVLFVMLVVSAAVVVMVEIPERGEPPCTASGHPALQEVWNFS